MKRPEKLLFIALWAIPVIGILAVLSVAIRKPPDFAKLKDEQVLDYLAAKDISSLNPSAANALGAKASAISPEKRQVFVKKLSSSEQTRFRRNIRVLFDSQMNRVIDDFFALPPDKQDEFLAKEIDRMQQRMSLGGPPPGGPPPGDGGGSAIGGTVRRGPPGRPDPAVRAQRMRNMLSETTPEQRAKRDAYMQRLMTKLGVKPGQRPPGPPGPPM